MGNNLGCGFLEKVYENALAYELRKAGLRVAQQFQIQIYYLTRREDPHYSWRGHIEAQRVPPTV